MGLTHAQILQFPEILGTRDFRVKQRHEFLKTLGRNQYDPLKPNYVSPIAIVSGTDEEFCIEVAKVSLMDFDKFVKTL